MADRQPITLYQLPVSEPFHVVVLVLTFLNIAKRFLSSRTCSLFLGPNDSAGRSFQVEMALYEVKADFTKYDLDIRNKPEFYAKKVNPLGKVCAGRTCPPTKLNTFCRFPPSSTEARRSPDPSRPPQTPL